MAESYVEADDIQRHMKLASEWGPFADGTMMKYMNEYGVHSSLGSDKIFIGMAD